MTAIEAINRLDALHPNTFTEEEKRTWIGQLDSIVKQNVIDTHEDPPATTEGQLLVPEPYTDVYVHWMEQKIDYFNSEITRYNNSVSKFNEQFTAFRNWYNQGHMPKGTRVKYW